MGEWKGLQLVSESLMQELGRETAKRMLIPGAVSECERQGYHAKKRPTVTWHEVDEIEYMMQPFPWDVVQGDWVIRFVIEVEEEEEIVPKGTYSIHRVLPRALGEDRTNSQFFISNELIESAVYDGYTPIDNQKPVITWWEITQAEVDKEKSIVGRPRFDIGDWRVHATIRIKEADGIPAGE